MMSDCHDSVWNGFSVGDKSFDRYIGIFAVDLHGRLTHLPSHNNELRHQSTFTSGFAEQRCISVNIDYSRKGATVVGRLRQGR